MSHTVFISHATEDLDLARLVCQSLENSGARCWMASRDLVAGIPYAESIVHAIGATRLLVLILSDSACRSPHVPREIERAASKGLPIATLKLRGTSLSPSLEYFVSQSHWIEVDPENPAEQITQLTAAVLAELEAARTHPEQ